MSTADINVSSCFPVWCVRFPESGLKVSATGSATAIVWNPGVKKAALMNDLGAGHHADFVCLERGDAFDDAVELASQECHRATLNIELFS